MSRSPDTIVAARLMARPDCFVGVEPPCRQAHSRIVAARRVGEHAERALSSPPLAGALTYRIDELDAVDIDQDQ